MAYLYEAGGRRSPIVGSLVSSSNVAGLGMTAKEMLKEVAKAKAKYRILIGMRNAVWYKLETDWGVPKITQMSDAWRTYYAAVRAGQTASKPAVDVPSSNLTTLNEWLAQVRKQITEANNALAAKKAAASGSATVSPSEDFVGPPAPGAPPVTTTEKKFPWVAVGGVSAVVLVGALVLRGRKK